MERLVKMLKLHGGVRNHVYVCTAGYETIGVGRNISESGLGLTDEEINILLMNDIERVKKELSSSFSWFVDLDEVRQNAIIDMCFNLGLSRLNQFVKALDGMAAKDYDKAADEFMDSRWSQQVGQRAVTITEMIRTGEYQ